MNTPLISVIMSVFNEDRYLSGSIESILGQTFKDFEFIIVDDASTDSSFEIMQKYAAKDSRIVLIKNSANQGLAMSLNNALRTARGQFIARMDGDDIAEKSRLECQIDFLNKNSRIDLVGSSMYLINTHNDIIARSDMVSDPAILKKLVYFKSPCLHPTWMFRSKILKDLKGYRNLPAAQDYDFLMRLYSFGYAISNITRPLLYYRVHEDKVSFDRSIKQIRLAKYLRRLYRNGAVLNDKFLNNEQIMPGTPSTAVQKIHSTSLRLFEKGRFLMKKNFLIRGMILLGVSAVLSPYMSYFIYCGFRAKLLERKAGNC
ncbi:MAG: glycosyltransferase [Nitrospirae bacterium]|nr:glycosyltransferase [Nitrospirota bacterium]